MGWWGKEKIQKWLAIIRPIGWRRLVPDPSPLNTRLKLQRVIFTLKKKKKKPLFFEFLFKQRSLSLSSLSRLENGVGCCIPERGPFSATH